MITIKKGDLLEAEEDIIAHQVNCHGVAGGLAAAVFEKWPHAESDYQQLCQRQVPWALLGLAQLTGEQNDGHIICNLYGQNQPGRDYQPKALLAALAQLGHHAQVTGRSVALPYKLSCGICGGDWDEVLAMIERTMKGVKCVIYRREGD